MESTDELALANKQIAKRRIMEGQSGEVRRIHIIYFLSRKGRIEHPHLIRVHHLSRNGVHLRDVKRWLSELRGKDMADSFSWSYKRRYKKGFLWQDLVDEDLLTPISDNEYVLKGSEISSTNFINGLSPYGEQQELIIQKEPPLIDQSDNKSSPKEETGENSLVLMDDSTQKRSEIEEPPPLYSTQTSTVTEDSIKIEEREDLDSPKEKKQEQEDEDNEEEEEAKGKFGNNSVHANSLNKRENNGKNFNASTPDLWASFNGKNSNANTPDSSASFNSNSTFMKSKSRSGGASSVLRGLLSCRRAVDTMDSTMIKINKYSNISTSSSNNKREICDSKTGICDIKREQINGGRKSWNGVSDSKKNKKSGFDEQKTKTVSAAYRPIHGPNCSQCGREFKPEKLHKHMKSCRGMKGFAKSEKKPTHITTSMDSPNQDSVSAYYYLTHK